MEAFDKLKRDKQSDAHCNYFEWDEQNFVLPKAYEVKASSDLADVMNIFYLAGGYDFFNVVDPKNYASKWLSFMGDLYAGITEGIYCNHKTLKNPLTEAQKRKLAKQGVPEIFIVDLNG